MKGKRPFYVYLALNAPHVPLQVPKEYEQLYAGRAYLPPNLVSSIAAFGNPAVWWPGIIAVVRRLGV